MSQQALQDEALREFVAEGFDIHGRISQILNCSESHVFEPEQIDGLYREMHTLKGTAQLFGLHQLALVTHTAEACLEPVRRGQLSLSKELVGLLLEVCDFIEEFLKGPLNAAKGVPGSDQQVTSIVTRLASQTLSHFEKNSWVVAKDQPVDFEIVDPSKSNDQSSSRQTADRSISDLGLTESHKEKLFTAGSISQEDKLLAAEPNFSKPQGQMNENWNAENSSIRVQISLLDRLMNLMGELVLVRNQVLQHARNSHDNAYLNLTQRLDIVTSELQDQAMRTRMQPLGLVLNKFQRVIRELSKELGKKIELRLVGADTELDRSIIEAIKDPLTHIVRNSCDHGCENPEERRKAAKNETGLVTIQAFQEGGQVVIEVSDDGRGIDPDRIRQVALKKGLVTAAELHAMNSTQVQMLVFAPGFTTTDHISSLSGRGVGMDVVKTNIEQIGGAIELTSSVGVGTSIRLKIPLTLAVVPSLIVQSDGLQLAIPQLKLQELLLVDPADSDDLVEEVEGQFFYRLRGELLPLIDLKNIFSSEAKASINKSIILSIAVLRHEKGLYGLVIDEVNDTADIVVKPFSPFFREVQLYSGATILGNGAVALILDVEGLARHSQLDLQIEKLNRESKGHALRIVGDEKFNIETGEYLIFASFSKEICAVPLSLVHRLEEFDKRLIQKADKELIIPYNGGLLSLMQIDSHLDGGQPLQFAGLPDKVQVFVTKKKDRFFGFLVKEILDIQTLRSEPEPYVKEVPGLIGTLLDQDKKTRTVIDVLDLMSRAMGEREPKGSFENKTRLAGDILYVEDTPFFFRQIQKFLSPIGLKITHVENGELALTMLRAGNQSFDLILSDIEMPVMNGWQLVQELKKDAALRKIPVIALTTRFSEKDRQQGRELGFDHYLEKIKHDELLQVLSIYLKEDRGAR